MILCCFMTRTMRWGLALRSIASSLIAIAALAGMG
jgi:hypothetical protein